MLRLVRLRGMQMDNSQLLKNCEYGPEAVYFAFPETSYKLISNGLFQKSNEAKEDYYYTLDYNLYINFKN